MAAFLEQWKNLRMFEMLDVFNVSVLIDTSC